MSYGYRRGNMVTISGDMEVDCHDALEAIMETMDIPNLLEAIIENDSGEVDNMVAARISEMDGDGAYRALSQEQRQYITSAELNGPFQPTYIDELDPSIVLDHIPAEDALRAIQNKIGTDEVARILCITQTNIDSAVTEIKANFSPIQICEMFGLVMTVKFKPTK